jgi:hypothetical protein
MSKTARSSNCRSAPIDGGIVFRFAEPVHAELFRARFNGARVRRSGSARCHADTVLFSFCMADLVPLE